MASSPDLGPDFRTCQQTMAWPIVACLALAAFVGLAAFAIYKVPSLPALASDVTDAVAGKVIQKIEMEIDQRRGRREDPMTKPGWVIRDVDSNNETRIYRFVDGLHTCYAFVQRSSGATSASCVRTLD